MVLPNIGGVFPAVLVVKLGDSFSYFVLKLGLVVPLSGGHFQLNIRKNDSKNTNIY